MDESEKKISIEEQLKQRILDKGKIPTHVAVIMDGNGRWAKKRGFSRLRGHEEGISSVRAVVEGCGEIGVKVLTLYTFSRENWRRPRSEVAGLWRLLIQTVRREVPELKKNNVQLRMIGIMEDLPMSVRKGLKYAMNELKNNDGLIVNLALNYGSRTEIIHAVQKIARKIANGEIKPEQIDDRLISQNLYTSDLPDPDFLIRTSGEKRISNFLLWQIAYAELYITDVLWPDFRKKEFYDAIISYQQRERRYGMVSEQLSKLQNDKKMQQMT
ncbi:MAG: isoprenyl transferase [Calditrichaeota bacterium]|nr:isoprenyl transferase [Calditrichota bacterium]